MSENFSDVRAYSGIRQVSNGGCEAFPGAAGPDSPHHSPWMKVGVSMERVRWPLTSSDPQVSILRPRVRSQRVALDSQREAVRPEPSGIRHLTVRPEQYVPL